MKKKWYIIGTKLNFSRRRLNTILNEQKNSPDKCLTILCEEWVNSSPDARWPAVLNALQSDLVDEKELASSLERKYCWIESPNSKTWVRLSMAICQSTWTDNIYLNTDRIGIFSKQDGGWPITILFVQYATLYAACLVGWLPQACLQRFCHTMAKSMVTTATFKGNSP